jgi:LAS superfamily LD-carboxypeptidase LdcB
MNSRQFRVLSGQNAEHIVQDPLPAGIARPIHVDMVDAFLSLQEDARQDGFDLQIVSGFRDFDRQLAIWNAKASGQRALLDSAGLALDVHRLDKARQVEAIMRWSALPGASRHHWGCDIDVYDARVVDGSHQVQLIPAEVSATGIFAALHSWLDEKIRTDSAYGFFRPYELDRGGIAPERWHLSYAPIAINYQQQDYFSALPGLLKAKKMLLADVVEENFEYLFRRFIELPLSCYPPRYRH